MEPADLLVNLDDAQRRAVTSDASPLCILAGAGSGKTRVLTNRIAYRAATGSLDPQRVLAITFTRKAAGELVERLASLGLPKTLTAGTFHSVAFAQLRGHWADLGERQPTVLDKPASFIMRLLPGSRSADFSDALDVATEIEWAKARMVDPDGYSFAATKARRNPTTGIAAVAEIFEIYEAEKQARGLIDMADLLDRYRRALADDKSFRASQHWRFRHIFVDEFQDVNPAQNALLEALLGNRSDLCVVGDPNQAIYSFNGAEQSFLINFASRQGPSGTIRLEQNYRSTPQILAISHSVLGKSASGFIRPTLEGGNIPSVMSHQNDRSEAKSIARALRDHHHKGDGWSHQAVLVRTNAQANVIAEALTAADIPFRLRGEQNRGDRASGSRSKGTQQKRAANRGADNFETSTNAPTDAVEISTFHAAKGLEWQVVHLAGLEKGLVPIAHARTPAAEAEEKRLLYVAITRAQRELHMNWAQERSFGSRTSQRDPSAYLEAIETTMAALERGEDPFSAPVVTEDSPNHSGKTAQGKAGRDSSRRKAEKSSSQGATSSGPKHIHRSRISRPGLDPSTRDLYEELRTWRSTRARAASVPAYVIFHDATLEAVATAAPRTLDDLIALPGLGPVKVGRYGDEILKLVADHS